MPNYEYPNNDLTNVDDILLLVTFQRWWNLSLDEILALVIFLLLTNYCLLYTIYFLLSGIWNVLGHFWTFWDPLDVLEQLGCFRTFF